MLKGRSALITGPTTGAGPGNGPAAGSRGLQHRAEWLDDAAEIERKRCQLEDEHGVRALHHGAPTSPIRRRVAALVDTAQAAFGTVDILIDNAVVRHFAPIEEFR